MNDSIEYSQQFPKKQYKKYLNIVNVKKTKDLTINKCT